MAIIKMTDLPINPPGYAGRLQTAGIEPGRAYRELLARDTVTPGGDHAAPPYEFVVPNATAITVAIPHGLSKDANGSPLSGTGRIPDVVTPLRVHYINAAVPDLVDVEILGAINDDGVPWPAGWCADASNVYLTLVNWDLANPATVRFYVYVEFTHSVIGDEAYTTPAFTSTVYIEDLRQ